MSSASRASDGPMISVQGLRKRFAGVTAVDGISFDVQRGEVLGFLGPNGAGKTTTMRVLAGYFPPTEGQVRVGGFDVVTQSMEVRQRVGYLPESVPLYSDMRVDEYLRFRARIKGVTGGEVEKRVDGALDRCILGDVRRRIIGQLSKGYRQRVGLADALVSDPPILILDEPTIGLDPNQIRQIRDVVKELGRDHTVILSTHILPEVEILCRRVLVIARGRIVLSDSVENLRAGKTGGGIRVEVRGAADRIAAALRSVSGVAAVEPAGAQDDVHRFLVRSARGGADLRESLAAELIKQGFGVREIAAERLSLEEVFGRITAGEDPAAAGAGAA